MPLSPSASSPSLASSSPQAPLHRRKLSSTASALTLANKSDTMTPESERRVATETEVAAAHSSFSFACGGWLKMYLFGVAKAMQEHELDKDGAQFIGCSAGALTATALAFRCDFDRIRQYVLEDVVPKAHASFRGKFGVRSYLRDTLSNVGQLHKFQELNDNRPPRLTVVYSSLSKWKSRRVTKFDSSEHLQQSLLASCCATPIAGLPFELNGEYVMDGGLLDFQPLLDKHTVTVSPFYCTGADIKPSRYIPLWWAMFPPSVEDVNWLFDLGYEDGLHWIVDQGLAKHDLDIPTVAADYDGAWTTTIGRVMGYKSFENQLLDALFVGLYVCIWKPMVFLLLYLELYLHAIVYGSKAAVFGAAAKLVISNVVLGVAVVTAMSAGVKDTMLFLIALAVFGALLGLLVLVCGGLHQAATMAASDWDNCRVCLRNITSLSLFLRSIPFVGTSIRIKRHEYLVRHSLIYRLTLHFV